VLVLTVFGGLASVVFAPLTGVLVDSLGWRDALVALAAILAVVCLPVHGLLLRTPHRRDRSPEGEPQRGADRARVLRSVSFRWLSLSLAVSTAARVAIAVHVIAYLTGRGYTLRQATLAGGAIGLFQVFGRATATALASRMSPQRVYSAIFTVQGASLALPLATSGHGAGATTAIVVFVMLYGLGFGLPELIRGVSVADYYGTASYASINGVLGFFVTMGRAIGPAAAGVAITVLGGYTLVLVAAALAAVFSAAALTAADRARTREGLAVGSSQLAETTEP
jgi:predicted MFS family arabinose efflux permease